MKRFAAFVLVFACGAASGWLAKLPASQAKPDADADFQRLNNTLNLEQPVVVNESLQNENLVKKVTSLEVHVVYIGEQRHQIKPVPEGKLGWTISFDDGRIKIIAY